MQLTSFIFVFQISVTIVAEDWSSFLLGGLDVTSREHVEGAWVSPVLVVHFPCAHDRSRCRRPWPAHGQQAGTCWGELQLSTRSSHHLALTALTPHICSLRRGLRRAEPVSCSWADAGRLVGTHAGWQLCVLASRKSQGPLGFLSFLLRDVPWTHMGPVLQRGSRRGALRDSLCSCWCCWRGTWLGPRHTADTPLSAWYMFQALWGDQHFHMSHPLHWSPCWTQAAGRTGFAVPPK